ncbi:MAG: nitrous oxide reductase family maturation protein NosD [Candidatus Thorarchaeota archaeon]
MNKKSTTGILTIIIVFLSLSIKTNATISLNMEEQITNSISLALVPHEPIEILNDGNFTDYGFDGTGTSGDPYIIEDYEIITNDDFGIYINGTTKHFIIRNCFTAASKRGISVLYTTEETAKVINNTCVNSYYHGIMIYFSSKATVVNNTCYNNDYGIYVAESNSTVVYNNTCNNNEIHGIRSRDSFNITITKNTFSHNSGGIYLDTCKNATITNNTLSWNGEYGLSLFYCSNSTLKYNIFNNSGIGIAESDVEYYSTYTIENNWVNDKLLGFFVDLDEISILDPIYGQLIIINCNTVVVSNQELTNTQNGLTLSSCGDVTITNNVCDNNYRYGISISASEATITDNFCNYNGWTGIDAIISSTAIISNNTCNNNGYQGIEVNGGSVVTIEDNTIIENDEYGLDLSNCPGLVVTNNYFYRNSLALTVLSCTDALIMNNNFTNNGMGIDLAFSIGAMIKNNNCSKNAYGIYLISDNITLTENIIKKNTMWGMFLDYSDYCLITYNLFQENYGYGVYLGEGCKYNIIHHNSFIANNPGKSSQAYDSGVNNTWYDEENKEGNYWSDWDSKKPYPIDGYANSTDNYPLNEELKRIYYEFMYIPSLILMAIVFSFLGKRKQKLKNND